MLFIFSIDFSQSICLKHLSREVINQLQRALEVDEVAQRHIFQSFGIKAPFRRPTDVFKLFPDTPVKLLKDVLDALQLYDFVDLLSEKPQTVRSLRPALPLQEVEKVRKTADGRPTTYHSSVAVLMIADEEDSYTEGIENFFKRLNSKSDVTIIECRNAWRTEFEMKEMELLDMRVKHARGRKMQTEEIQKQKEELQKKIQNKKEEMRTEIEKIKTAASAVIDRWIHDQGWS